MQKVIDYCFRQLKLHRLEANIQPENERSISFVKGLGFRREGFSPQYLQVCGRWRDHERWALLSEGWRRGGGAA
jgi:ribosomal-protein-alanine N-acetyltransferase